MVCHNYKYDVYVTMGMKLLHECIVAAMRLLTRLQGQSLSDQ